MESFFRYIAYVDYYEKGLRIHNAGFLRWKFVGNRHRLEIEIKDMGNLSGCFALREEKERKRIAYIDLEKGQGSLKESFEAFDRGGHLFLAGAEGEIDLTGLKALQIELEKDRNLYIPIELPLPERRAAKEEPSAFQIEAAQANDRHMDKATKENIREISEITVKAEGAIQEEKKEPPKFHSKKPREEAAQLRVHPPLEEDKWEQLCRHYPQVHPFPGGKTFVTIKPEDFIILQEKYQRLVHNSFLLHGYYNYQHMILGKLEDGEEVPYYIGVPGVFYEKEKQAAGLFGFAGFEGTEFPVRNGSFGYYMIEVKL